jgi:hypothetical protein
MKERRFYHGAIHKVKWPASFQNAARNIPHCNIGGPGGARKSLSRQAEHLLEPSARHVI